VTISSRAWTEDHQHRLFDHHAVGTRPDQRIIVNVRLSKPPQGRIRQVNEFTNEPPLVEQIAAATNLQITQEYRGILSHFQFSSGESRSRRYGKSTPPSNAGASSAKPFHSAKALASGRVGANSPIPVVGMSLIRTLRENRTAFGRRYGDHHRLAGRPRTSRSSRLGHRPRTIPAASATQAPRMCSAFAATTLPMKETVSKVASAAADRPRRLAWIPDLYMLTW
jgi:hypothetical protein